MALRDTLASAPKGRGHYCTVGFTLVEVATNASPEDYDTLLAALAAKEWSSMALVKALDAEGYNVTFEHMKKHRRGDCTTASCSFANTGTRTP